MKLNRYALFAWGTVGYNLLVIMWGAFVRATGSGAGCGDHWPLCNGEVIPRAPQMETIIEMTHRVTSGIALLMVLAMLVWAYRAYPRGHLVRRGAKWSMILMVIEALLGAGLVLLQLVADNDTVWRAIAMAVHLVNTFLLLGAIVLTAWWASGGPDFRLRGQGLAGASLVAGMVGFFVLGASGAVTALGDTLFNAISLSEARALGIEHWLLPLRVFHPVIAIGVAVYLSAVAGLVSLARPHPTTRLLAGWVAGLFLVQIAVGFLNIYLRAPVWMQLVHLLLADLVWIAFLLFTASAMAVQPAAARAAAPAPSAGRGQAAPA